MRPKPSLEAVVLLITLILCLVVLALVATSPAFDFDTRVVYRGF
jgi:hypothetical protein